MNNYPAFIYKLTQMRFLCARFAATLCIAII